MSQGELTLRYGCNPHQSSARVFHASGKLPFEVLNGSPGYINLLDALNSWQLVRELKAVLNLPAAASFKHLSPAGAAVAVPLSDALKKAYFVNDLELSPLATAYARARGADRLSSFGDWIALSDEVDVSTAKLIGREVSDGIVAPGYAPEALEILKKKKGGNYVVLQMDETYKPAETEKREVFGVVLEQTINDKLITADLLQNVVSENKTVSSDAERDMLVATIALKYTQSNSICMALDGQVIGNGAGQQNRLACTDIAAGKAEAWYLRQHPDILGLQFKKGLKRPEKINAIEAYLRGDMSEQERGLWQVNFEVVPEPLSAEKRREWIDQLQGVVLSSDAFIPFRDNVDRAVKSGVGYVVETGGSLRDDDVIAAANEYGMVLVLTGVRLFHH
ncbi:MAG: phosphoribosylaminoimidazolecarboxamide formyltransferase [Candidatus Latescibacteria bacterium]|jgi:phosphoribosylaminoimidazolecarboxamide formyltransferase / IMP cyclohydrolase|nr:phosphoribosylaminoimidazolecarboxamide formyltransferase [Candidatus Latescibacterota bacterium]MBT5831503.1 phosphoribosylaminoimidazolecarboxamide formyltransferase [Candidatus Latescibacterota bacterium]